MSMHWQAGAVALKELRTEGVGRREKISSEHAGLLHEGLAGLPHVRTFGKAGALATASLVIEDLAPSDAAAILDAEFGVETRAGWHCAALIHGYLGSEPQGTLRISAGHTTTAAEIEAAVSAVGQIARTLHSH